MPPSVVPKETWQEVRKAYEGGVPYAKLSEIYGISQQTIRKRASTEKWITSERIKEAPYNHKVKKEIKEYRETGVSHGLSGEAAIALSLGEIAEKQVASANYVHRKIAKAEQADMLPDLDRWKDYLAAQRQLRSILGLDRPQVAIQINPFGHGGVSINGHEACYEPLEVEE